MTIGRNLAPSQRAGDLIALIRRIRFPNPSFAGGLLLLRVLRSHQDDEDDGVTTASQALPAIFNFPEAAEVSRPGPLESRMRHQALHIDLFGSKNSGPDWPQRGIIEGRVEMPA